MFVRTGCIRCTLGKHFGKPVKGVNVYHPGYNEKHSMFSQVLDVVTPLPEHWKLFRWDFQRDDFTPHYVYFFQRNGKKFVFADCVTKNHDHSHSINLMETILEVFNP